MAKRKSATALFEVINKSRGFERGGIAAIKPAGGIRSWFKHSTPRMPVPVAMPVRAAVEAPRSAAATESHEAVATMTEPPIPGDEHPQSAFDAVGSTADAFHDTDEPAGDHETADIADAPLTQPIAVSLDYERRFVSLRMNYTVAIVAAFSLVVAIVLAVAVGKNLAREATPVLAPTSTASLRQQPAHPGVLNITTGGSGEPHDAAHGTTVLATERTGPTAAHPPAFNEPRPPQNFVARDARRSVGLNYVVIQSYPSEKLATDAADFLNKHDVACTIERKLKNWPDSLYLVVGIDGFTRISSPEYKAYIAKIEKLSAQYASPKSFKAFEPTGKKWDKSE